MDTVAKKFQSSSLSRNSSAVFRAAEEAPVEVTRRDGSSLTLMSSEENAERDQLLELAAQIIVITTRDDGRSLGDRFADHFGWMLALSEADKQECARDLIASARASFSTKKAHLAIATLVAWHGTALAIAEGVTNEPIEWLDSDIAVERP